jgi:hypothetical protein
MLNEHLVAKRLNQQQVFTTTKYYEYEERFLCNVFTAGSWVFN